MIIAHQPTFPPTGAVALGFTPPFFDSWAWRNRTLVAGGILGAIGLGIFGLAAVFNSSPLGDSEATKSGYRPKSRRDEPRPSWFRRHLAGASDTITAVSAARYRADARERRLYGGSTVTDFYVAQGGVTRLVRGYGKTPGERKSDAMRRFAAEKGK